MDLYTRFNRADLRRVLGGLTGKIVGDLTILTRVGKVVLGRVFQAFVAKMIGGTDDAGDSWTPLSPRTIAYGRRHSGKRKTTAATRPSSALTKRQRDRWWEVYRKWVAIFHKRRVGGKSEAARIAWATLKREGAETILSRYGNMSVEILRDTGLLLSSLWPNGGKHQVFRVERGVVYVGTNRKGAVEHHRGSPSRNLPQRRLWPDTRKWPGSWWVDIMEPVKQGAMHIAVELVRSVASS